MINHIDSFKEAGTKEAVARNHHDEALAQHWHDFHRRMLAAEKPEDRELATKAYLDAYKEERTTKFIQSNI